MNTKGMASPETRFPFSVPSSPFRVLCGVSTLFVALGASLHAPQARPGGEFELPTSYFEPSPTCRPTVETHQVERSLQALLERLLGENPGAPGIEMHVEAPRLCLSWDGAAGVIDRKSGRPLKPENPFRIASITKQFTATSILRLIEDGRFSLDDPLGPLLPEAYRALLLEGGYKPDQMPLRYVLSHTSGLFNYTATREYADTAFDHPEKRWTALEQIQYAVRYGHRLGAPGEVFHYADTGFVLLARVVEKATGKSMPEAFRQLVGMDGLDLKSTWMESLEPAPPNIPERAHQYYGHIDTFNWDPSLDLYGGGGLVSTGRDLAKFERALVRGKIFHDPATTPIMLHTIVSPVQRNYRLGIEELRAGGETGWGHWGSWNTFSYCFPDSDITVAGSMSQAVGVLPPQEIAVRAFRVVKAAMPSGESLRKP